MRELSRGEDGAPPNWLPNFRLVGATEIPAGRFAPVRDPQGAAFSIFEGAVDD